MKMISTVRKKTNLHSRCFVSRHKVQFVENYWLTIFSRSEAWTKRKLSISKNNFFFQLYFCFCELVWKIQYSCFSLKVLLLYCYGIHTNSMHWREWEALEGHSLGCGEDAIDELGILAIVCALHNRTGRLCNKSRHEASAIRFKLILCPQLHKISHISCAQKVWSARLELHPPDRISIAQ